MDFLFISIQKMNRVKIVKAVQFRFFSSYIREKKNYKSWGLRLGEENGRDLLGDFVAGRFSQN